MQFPDSIENLIYQFKRLPGLGPKSAERLVFALLKNKSQLENLKNALAQITDRIKYCSLCQNISETDPCPVCRDPKRDKHKLCIVSKPQDYLSIENTGDYNGLYHILWGYLNAIDGITPDKLKINELTKRLTNENITEVIMAFNPNLSGESTMLYLQKLLEPYHIKTTRLALGLSMGSEIEYADEITLANALKGRQTI